jgi:flagellin
MVTALKNAALCRLTFDPVEPSGLVCMLIVLFVLASRNMLSVAPLDVKFADLQVQLHQMSQQTFNGVSLFANFTSNGATESIFRDASTNNTISIHTSPDGSTGSKVSLHKAAFLSAVTIDANALSTGVVYSGANNAAAANTGGSFTFASADTTTTMTLDKVSSAVFQQALENVAFLRAQIGGTTSRVAMAADNLSLQKTNMKAALGRIEDVDIVEETANLAKYNMLTQASAAMLSQANASSDIALMLLR